MKGRLGREAQSPFFIVPRGNVSDNITQLGFSCASMKPRGRSPLHHARPHWQEQKKRRLRYRRAPRLEFGIQGVLGRGSIGSISKSSQMGESDVSPSRACPLAQTTSAPPIVQPVYRGSPVSF